MFDVPEFIDYNVQGVLSGFGCALAFSQTAKCA
jgi:hypothetical protein